MIVQILILFKWLNSIPLHEYKNNLSNVVPIGTLRLSTHYSSKYCFSKHLCTYFHVLLFKLMFGMCLVHMEKVEKFYIH